MDYTSFAREFVVIFNIVVLFYFAALNSIYIMLFTAALFQSKRFVRRRKIVDLTEVFRSPLTPSISMMIPAYNEEMSIAEAVKAVLMLHYPHFEVIVINDGSSDNTLDVLISRYKLERITKVVKSQVPCREIRGVYISREYDNLVVVDKENGGKADALNAGINVSRHDLICVIDADSLIEADGLLKVARPFIEDPTRTVATGGLVRIVNGCTVEASRITNVKLPRNILVNLQIVEYLRAFMGGRMGWSALQSLLIISGAFGLFKRETVIEIGGYRLETVGEDMDLVVRMHRHLREKKQKYRMYFVPDPVCWTEAPEKYKQLAKQRDRWQRGLIESLASNLKMLLNPRYGTIGLFAMPYFFFFEMLGPAIELTGYFAVVLALLLGLVNYQFMLLFIALAFLYSIAVSLFAVFLEGVAFQRYTRIRSLLILAFFAIIENLGFRQINSWWRSKAYFTYFTRKQKWGEIHHEGYGEAETTVPETPAAVTEVQAKPATTIMAPEVAAVNAETGNIVSVLRPRFAWLLVIIFVITATIVPLSISRKRSGDNFHESPVPVKTEGSEITARARGEYFEVHTASGWHKFTVKGVNVGTALPGHWFSEFPEDENLYIEWFEKIAGMNANTIRIYTLLDPVFYRALEKFNRSSDTKLMFFQEIWPDDEIPDYNLYDEKYSEDYRKEIETDIKALRGSVTIPERNGRAWGEYNTDVSDYILGLMIGREILHEEAKATNALNPTHNRYEGAFISAVTGSNPVESWLAEMCDFAVTEMKAGGWQAPVSFVSWPTLDPMTHPTESTPGQTKEQEREDAETFDPNHLKASGGAPAGLFGCYHIYPHYPDFMGRETGYAEYRDGQGILRYGGYLQQFIDLHPDYPALIGEFGISTSLGIAHLNPEGFSHGGVSEKDQGVMISRMYKAILEEGYAGGILFEWADEWAKRTWVDMAYMIPLDRHIYWHNMMDPEQNYGLLAYEAPERPFNEESSAYSIVTGGKDEIRQISVDHDAAFLYLKIDLADKLASDLKPGGKKDVELDIGIDTLGKNSGTRTLPVKDLPKLPTGVEFLLKINAKDGGMLLAKPDYDIGTSKFMAAQSVDPSFVPIMILVNREQVSTDTGRVFPEEYTNNSILFYGNFDPGSDKFDSLSNWYVSDDGTTVYVRLPWLLLNVSDPSSRTVIHDDRTDLPVGPSGISDYLGVDGLHTEKTDGFLFYAALTGDGKLTDFQPRSGKKFDGKVKRFTWPGWDVPQYKERLKQSYLEVSNMFK